jgi:hypothetical protein
MAARSTLRTTIAMPGRALSGKPITELTAIPMITARIIGLTADSPGKERIENAAEAMTIVRNTPQLRLPM